LQDLAVLGDVVKGGKKDALPLYEVMGYYVDSWGADSVGDSGYSNVGAVVGATFPEQAKALRAIMPGVYFLVPGYGAQGGGAADVKPCFNDDGLGAIVNSSRGITFAYEKDESRGPEAYADAAREAVIAMKEDLAKVL
jgi:orotidine-5'-phosphate decarboxylase